MTDYQFSLVDEFEELGRMEYRAFDSDAAALEYAKGLMREQLHLGRVTVLDGPRIVGMLDRRRA